MRGVERSWLLFLAKSEKDPNESPIRAVFSWFQSRADAMKSWRFDRSDQMKSRAATDSETAPETERRKLRNRSPAHAASECARMKGKRDFGAPRTSLVEVKLVREKVSKGHRDAGSHAPAAGGDGPSPKR